MSRERKRKIKYIAAAAVCVAVLTLAPAFSAGALKVSSLFLIAGETSEVRMTNPILQRAARYAADDESVVSVKPDGQVEAVRPGKTKIRIRVPFRTLTVGVHVLGFPEKEVVMEPGENRELSVAGASKKAGIFSSDENVVRISDGQLLAGKSGEATVTCRDHGNETVQTVRVEGLTAQWPYLFVGNSMQMSAGDRISGIVTGWHVDDPSVASVDRSGLVTGLHPGETTVSCLDADGKMQEAQIRVIGMRESGLYLQMGETCEAPLTDTGGTDLSQVEWTTGDTGIVRVDSAGTLTAVGAGETDLICFSDGQQLFGRVHVMSMPDHAYTAVGLSSGLQLEGVDEAEVSWESSDKSVVRAKDGRLQGIKKGTAQVTAAVRGRRFDCDVTVLKFSDPELKLEKNAAKTVQIKGLGGEDAPEVTWSSQDKKVAKVSKKGKVTPVDDGITVLLCEIGSSAIEIPVTVGDGTFKDDENKNADGTMSADASGAGGSGYSTGGSASGGSSSGGSTSGGSSSGGSTSGSSSSGGSTSGGSSSGGSSSGGGSIGSGSSHSEPAVPKPEIIAGTGRKLTGAEAIIACGNYYCKVLDEAVEKGEKWVYSNSSRYVAQSGSFEKMLAGKIRGGNCAVIANWAFRDMGILSSSQKFYGDSSGKIRNYNSGSTQIKRALDKCCNIMSYEGKNKSFGTLVKEGKIKVGDVIIGANHTFIYRGGGTVFASGHDAKWHRDSSVKTDDPNKAVFEKWIINYKGTFDERYKVHFVIRVKDSFVPKYYRDDAGNLVKNR